MFNRVLGLGLALLGSSQGAAAQTVNSYSGAKAQDDYRYNTEYLVTEPQYSDGTKEKVWFYMFLPHNQGNWYNKMLPSYKMALDELNASTTLLPNTHLGLIMGHDTQCTEVGAQGAFLWTLQTRRMPRTIGVLGDACSGSCKGLNLAMQMYALYQVTPICTADYLSSQGTYTNLLRFSPPTSHFTEASFDMFKTLFKVKKLALLSENRAINTGMAQHIRKLVDLDLASGDYDWDLITKNEPVTEGVTTAVGVTATHTIMFEGIAQDDVALGTIKSAVARLKELDTRATFFSFYEKAAARFFCAAYRQGLYGKHIWIGAGSWWNADWITIFAPQTDFNDGLGPCTEEELFEAAKGVMGSDRGPFTYSTGTHGISGRNLQDIKADYVTACNQPAVTGAKAELTGCHMGFSHYAYDAIWSIGKMLDQWLTTNNNDYSRLDNDSAGALIDKNVASEMWTIQKGFSFFGLSGAVSHNPVNGDRVGNFRIAQVRGLDGTVGNGQMENVLLWTKANGYEWLHDLKFRKLGGGEYTFAGLTDNIQTHTAAHMANMPLDGPLPCGSAKTLSTGYLDDSCVDCAAGTYGSAAGVCSPCPLGESQPLAGQTACVPCAAGSFANVTGSANCHTVEPGYFVPFAGASTPTPCLPGTINTVAGATECTDCAAGDYQNEAGQASCKTCAAGEFAAKEGSSGCAVCARGTFSAAAGSIECTPCEQDTFQDTDGQSTCKACSTVQRDGNGGFTATLRQGSRSPDDCGCPAGQFYSMSSKACEQCPEGIDCGFGSHIDTLGATGSAMQVAAGYWVNSNAEPVEVYQCERAENCPGGGLKSCADGHSTEHIGCGRCETNYSMSSSGTCQSCEGGDGALAVLVGLLFLFAPLVLCLILNDPVSSASKRARIQGSFTPVMVLMQQFAFLFIIGQLTAIVGDIRLALPEYLKEFLAFMSIFMFDVRMFRTSCVLGTSPVAMYLLVCLLPMLCLGVVLAFSKLSQVLGGGSKRKGHVMVAPVWVLSRPLVLNTFGGLFQTLFIVVAVNSIKSFHCRPNPSAPSTMVSMPSVRCDAALEPEYGSLVAISALSLAIYVVGFGAWFVRTVHMLDELEATASAAYLASIRFITARFRPEARYWGMPFMFRSLCTSLVFLIDPNQPALQLFYLKVVMALYLVGLCMVWPWRVHQLGVVDAVTSCCVLLLLQAAQGLAPQPVGAEKDFLVVVFGISVAIVLATIVVFVAMLYGGMLKSMGGGSGAGKISEHLPEGLLQFCLDVSPRNVPDLKSVRDDCAQCGSQMISSRKSRKSRVSGKGGVAGKQRDAYDFFLVSVLSMLNDYVCLATRDASSAREMAEVVATSGAYFEKSMKTASASGVSFPVAKVGSANASKTQSSKDPVTLYRAAEEAREQVQSLMSRLSGFGSAKTRPIKPLFNVLLDCVCSTSRCAEESDVSEGNPSQLGAHCAEQHNICSAYHVSGSIDELCKALETFTNSSDVEVVAVDNSFVDAGVIPARVSVEFAISNAPGAHISTMEFFVQDSVPPTNERFYDAYLDSVTMSAFAASRHSA